MQEPQLKVVMLYTYQCHEDKVAFDQGYVQDPLLGLSWQIRTKIQDHGRSIDTKCRTDRVNGVQFHIYKFDMVVPTSHQTQGPCADPYHGPVPAVPAIPALPTFCDGFCIGSNGIDAVGLL